MIIRNLHELSSRGNIHGRDVVLKTIEGALGQVNSYDLVKGQVFLLENDLRIGTLTYDLKKIKDIFVVGGGKQVTFVASAIEDILQKRIREGVVVEKKGWGCKVNRTRVVEGGHPIPDEGSVRGAEEIIRIARRADEDDLVIVCVTGGCTSLTMLPPPGLSLEDAREVTRLLLESGAPLEDMNTVRNHLSQIGGGRLSMLARPAEIVSLIAVDEVAGGPWGPTVPDTTSFSDAKRVLMRHNVWFKVPSTVRDYLESADSQEETPKSIDFERAGVKVRHVVFADNNMLCQSAQKKATELGANVATLSTKIEGEAKDVGVVLASIAKEIEMSDRPFKAPCILVAGGETTVTLGAEHGEGGRNQELALAAALKIAGSERTTLASIGTDGTDGPTDIAGAIVDGYTLEDANKAGIDLFEHLKMHDSSNVFRKLNDAIYTGNTATNLMDLIIIYVCQGSRTGRTVLRKQG
jgi:glycerate 2-kinase